MEMRRAVPLFLLAGVLGAGCNTEPGIEDDGAVPAGAIPAAADVRPGVGEQDAAPSQVADTAQEPVGTDLGTAEVVQPAVSADSAGASGQ